MSHVPAEDLNVIAMQLDADYRAKIMGPPNWPDGEAVESPDWRHFIPGQIRRVWGRMDYGERLVAFIVASEAANWSDED